MGPDGSPYVDLATLTTGTADDVGQYEVTIRTYQDIGNPNHGFTDPYRGVIPDHLHTMKVTINPCPVTDLVSATVQPDISYRIGEAEVVLGTYSMIESPNNCGYEKTYTVTGLPNWIIHDENAKDFRVPQTTDSSLVGVYTVTITGAVSVPDDYTKASYTSRTGSQDFNIFVEPCITTSVTSNVLGNVEYVIGAAGGVDSDSYAFTQEPADCDYEIEIIITGLEPFMVHDEVS